MGKDVLMTSPIMSMALPSWASATVVGTTNIPLQSLTDLSFRTEEGQRACLGHRPAFWAGLLTITHVSEVFGSFLTVILGLHRDIFEVSSTRKRISQICFGVLRMCLFFLHFYIHHPFVSHWLLFVSVLMCE
uniref:Uncharacterized protein n=1 Tax=Ixodes scapularis TaxID=6945 RepID=A0A4D5S2V6_IXOSC